MDTFGQGRVGTTSDQQGSDTPRGWKPSLDRPIPPTRCAAQNSQAMQCKSWSLPGSQHCETHSTNLDKKNAQEIVSAGRDRLMGLVDKAIETMEDLLEPGVPEAVRLKASTEILDRTGLPKGAEINVTVEHRRGADIVADKLEAIRARAEADYRADEDIEDAELVEDTGTVE